MRMKEKVVDLNIRDVQVAAKYNLKIAGVTLGK